jgi:hypothetical protein
MELRCYKATRSPFRLLVPSPFLTHPSPVQCSMADRLTFPHNLLSSGFFQEYRPANPHLSQSSLHDLFFFLWARDDYSYEHPRYRIQTAFAIMLCTQLGLQPISVFNEGLFYRDFTLLIVRDGVSYRLLLSLYITHRNSQHTGAKRWKEYVTRLSDLNKGLLYLGLR